ncbi:pre-mRNA-splicing factor 38B [Platysternon megacephalum]|uniref:Pre-mRNA-splicing factor 38B n=1 Tax=Platysternon megacephalum TaxID=55544 RepID=A0A4D9EU76_9SAUR|nr:pre-mRNA-splicing factor 38B [Platysternon megacephalum]
MWPAGAAGRLPCPRDSALRRAAFSGNLSALPSHLAPSGRSVRVFISANPEGNSPARVGPATGRPPPRGGPGVPLALQPRATPFRGLPGAAPAVSPQGPPPLMPGIASLAP